MKIINVQHKDIHITLEFPLSQLKKLVDFIDKSLPLFGKVHQGEEDLVDFISGNNEILKNLLEEIEHGS